jgi:2-haloacid dehalogenase
MKYPYIIFDADNTILDFTWSEADALRQTLSEAAGADFNPEIHIPLYRDINRQIWDQFENGEIDSENLKTERFRRFFSEIGSDNSPDEVSGTYLKYLAQSARFITGAEELLQKLSAPGICLALVTNGLTRVQTPRFRAAGMDRYFPIILISEELGTAKPDPEIFSLACDKMGVSNKREVLMVGDNLNSDIRGGNGFGIDTCWFNPDRLPRENGILPTYEIKELRELEAVLDLH